MSSNWRKSTHSAVGNCVAAASWRKARASVHNNACVEAGHGAGVIGIRDTQDPSLVLEVSPAAWRGLVTAIRKAEG
jgi:hypothetical protein